MRWIKCRLLPVDLLLVDGSSHNSFGVSGRIHVFAKIAIALEPDIHCSTPSRANLESAIEIALQLMAISADARNIKFIGAEHCVLGPAPPIAHEQHLHIIFRPNVNCIMFHCRVIGPTEIEDPRVIVPAYVVLNHRPDVAKVFNRIAFARRADKHEPAFIVMTVVVKEVSVSGIVVRVKAFTITRRMCECGLIELEE